MRVLRSNWFLILLPLALWFSGPFNENPNHAIYDSYYAHILLLIGVNVILATSLQLINGISGQFSLGHAGFMAIGAYAAGFATKTYSAFPTRDDSGDPFANPGGVGLFFVVLCGVLAVMGIFLAGIFCVVRRGRALGRQAPAIIVLILVLWFVADLCIAHKIAARWWLVWDQSITGIQKLYGFLIAGGTPAAVGFSHHFPAAWAKPLCLAIALLGAALLAGVAGLMVGLPTLRLRGDYLAIATLGFGEIIRVVITNCDALCKATGLQVPPYSDPDPDTGVPSHYLSRWIVAFAFLTPLLVWRLARSPRGAVIRAVREDVVAAAAVGINTTRQKVTAFTLGAAFAGIGGALYAHLDGYLTPDSFGFMRSVELVVMVTIAGLGNVWWTILAAAALTYLKEDFLGIIGQHFGYPKLADWRMVFYSLLLILVPVSQAVLWPRLRRRLRRA